MTQTPFKAFNSQEEFNPVKSAGEGLIQSAKQNQDEFLASITKRNADLFKFELADAQRKDNRWSKLANLSKTAASVAEPMIEAHNNEKYMEGAEAWYNVSAKNQELLAAEFDAEELQDTIEDTAHGKIVEKSYKNNEIDVFLRNELSNLTPKQQQGFLREMYKDRAQQYPMFLQQNSLVPVQIKLPDGSFVQKTLAEADNPNEYRQIQQRLYRAYIRPFASHDQRGVNKYMYEKMREHDATHYNQWYQKKTGEIIANDKEKAIGQVLTSIGTPEFGSEVESFLNKYETTYGGAKQTRAVLYERIEEEMYAGTFTETHLDALGDHEMMARDGSGKKKFRDIFKKEFKTLERKYLDYKSGILDDEQKKHEHSKKTVRNDFRAFVQKMKDDEMPIHDAHEELWQRKWTDETGLSTEPDFLKNHKTVQERKADDDFDYLKALRAKRGYLIKSDTDGMHHDVFNRVSQWITEDQNIAKAADTYTKRAKTEIGAFTRQATGESEGNPDKSKEYWRAFHAAVDDYNAIVADEIKGGETPVKAHQIALQLVEKDFKLGDIRGPVVASKYFKREKVTRNIAQSEAILDGIDSLKVHSTKQDQLNYINSTVIPGSEDYLELGKKYSLGVGDIPYYYTRLAMSFPKLTAWDILDAQLKASGQKEGLGEKHPIDSTLEIPGLEDLRRKLGYKPNVVSNTQATIDVEDANNQEDKEEVEDNTAYISLWNSNTELMFPGIRLPQV
tara:strand:- start:4180 stop:6372 length:2193 start_codon:yes stop_codon:yes gene_type:complete